MQGEEGNIEESEAIMNEVEKHRLAKRELENILEGGIGDTDAIMNSRPDETNADPTKPDRNMKVCEVCGALQSNADTDDRMQMHLEGKLH